MSWGPWPPPEEEHLHAWPSIQWAAIPEQAVFIYTPCVQCWLGWELGHQDRAMGWCADLRAQPRKAWNKSSRPGEIQDN
jgi:hypothetical protein